MELTKISPLQKWVIGVLLSLVVGVVLGFLLKWRSDHEGARSRPQSSTEPLENGRIDPIPLTPSHASSTDSPVRRPTKPEDMAKLDLDDWNQLDIRPVQKKGYPEKLLLSEEIVSLLGLPPEKVSIVEEIIAEQVDEMIDFNSMRSHISENPIDRNRHWVSSFTFESDVEGSVSKRAMFESAMEEAIGTTASNYLMAKLNPMFDRHPIVRGFGKMKLRVTFSDVIETDTYQGTYHYIEVLLSPEGRRLGSHSAQPNELPERYRRVFNLEVSQ